ncbi:hypothetical protein KC345_g34 [Hortaea werneckii]|nr:hypothetical protein KC345_g34 [Hortaea werneckii]
MPNAAGRLDGNAKQPSSTFETAMAQFRAKRLDLGCFTNIKIIRDHTKRKVFEEHEPERQALRYMIRNTSLPQRTRAQAQLQLTQMHCYTRPTQIRNRCIMGGKGRGNTWRQEGELVVC